MMAETSYYRAPAVSVRQWLREGAFGTIFYTEAEYHHPGIDALFFDSHGRRTWRYGRPPMFQSSHCTAYVVGVTGERLTHVSCLGFNDGSLPYKENVYNNPFANETALFKTDLGNALRVSRTWTGAHAGTERASWYGETMSYFMEHPNGMPPTLVRPAKADGADDAGFRRSEATPEPYDQPDWAMSDILPEPMRVSTGHGGSHTLLTHEFVDAVMRDRTPAVSVEVALAMAAAAVTAHQSALDGGAQLAIPQFSL
jgi:predicted dehydrogenase